VSAFQFEHVEVGNDRCPAEVWTLAAGERAADKEDGSVIGSRAVAQRGESEFGEARVQFFGEGRRAGFPALRDAAI